MTTAAVLRLTALVALQLTQTLFDGVDGHYRADESARYYKLDKFARDRMDLNLGGRRPTEDRKLVPEVRHKWDRLRHENHKNERDNELIGENTQNQQSAVLPNEGRSNENRDKMSALSVDKMLIEGMKCKTPRLKVIKVSDIHDKYNSNIRNSPACIQLHVCSHDTGCCNNDFHTCGVKSEQTVEIKIKRFYLMDQSEKDVLLPFVNHTECECKSINNIQMINDDPFSNNEADVNPFSNAQWTADSNCMCPTEYTVRYMSDGECSCDCFDKQHECIQFKKGKKFFHHQDRYCIESGQCLLPKCEYGVYSQRKGRCPQKSEMQFKSLFQKKNFL